MLHLHHTKSIDSGAVDWIKQIALKKYNFQLFGTTKRVLNDFLCTPK
jgi:hypothetical protein